MAMEPIQDYARPEERAPYEVQLMNLGRIIEDPSLLKLFEPEDFINSDIAILIGILKSDKPVEAKRLHLKSFMKRRGLKNWGDDSEGCKKELFDTQRRQAAIRKLAWETHLMIRTLQEGNPEDTSGVLKSLEHVKGFIENASS
jgi:hypothetical protein